MKKMICAELKDPELDQKGAVFQTEDGKIEPAPLGGTVMFYLHARRPGQFYSPIQVLKFGLSVRNKVALSHRIRSNICSYATLMGSEQCIMMLN